MIAVIIIVAISAGILTLYGLAWWFVLTYMLKAHSFLHKTCVVVGSSNGIGKCIVEELRKKGVGRLILLDKVLPASSSSSSSSSLTIPCDLNLIPTEFIQCDVSDSTEVARACESFREIPIHLVVLCAGIVQGHTLETMTCEEFDRTLRTNLSSQFYLLKHILSARNPSTRLSVVSLSSIMGLFGGAKLADYCASKFAVVGLFECLRLEYAHVYPMVTFSTVCPYVVNTGMFEGIFAKEPWWFKKLFPVLSPEQVAGEVVLAAERGRPLTVVPFYLGPLINILRCLPACLYYPVLIAMGGKRGMDSFQGKRRV